jgi:hypothetical protein
LKRFPFFFWGHFFFLCAFNFVPWQVVFQSPSSDTKGW